MNNPHVGTDFDAFLDEEGLLDDATAVAVKRVIAYQIQQAMDAQHMTKTTLAKKMNTSRAALNRLLDDTDTSLTLTTLTNAAKVLGKKISIDLTPSVI
jgi:predicted XRE-type DNA-binding protein